MSIKILTYIGTVLIAFEFVREFTDFQALAGMSFGYPFTYVNKNWKNFNRRLGFFKVPVLISILLAAVCITIAMIPFTILFYTLWFIIRILDLFHGWVNDVYSKGWDFYGFLVKPAINESLALHGKRHDHRLQQRVKEKLKERKIRIIPIIGLITGSNK